MTQPKHKLSEQALAGFVIISGFLICGAIFQLGLPANGGVFLDQVSFVTDISFMNTVHIGFTFIGLFFLKEMREWSINFAAEDRWLGLWLMLPFLFFGGMYAAFYESGTFWKLSRVSLRAYGVHHAAMQSYGLFILGGVNPSKTTFKKYFFALSAVYALALLTFEFAPKEMRPTFLYPLTAVAGLAFVIIMLKARRFKEERLFLSRLVVYPLGIVNPFAGMAISALHGTEYALTFKHMMNHSSSRAELKSGTRRNLGICAVFIVFAVLCLFLSRKGTFAYAASASAPLALMLLWACMDSLNVLHYYFDSKLFRAKSASSRKHILPLLQEEYPVYAHARAGGN